MTKEILKCEECGELKRDEPYAHNKPESEPAHKSMLVCVNEKCKNFNKVIN